MVQAVVTVIRVPAGGMISAIRPAVPSVAGAVDYLRFAVWIALVAMGIAVAIASVSLTVSYFAKRSGATRRAIAAIDALIPVAVVIDLGCVVVAIIYRNELQIGITMAFVWACIVLAQVAWYNFVAAALELPPLEVWDRERRAWREPWVPPAALVFGVWIGISAWS